MEKLKPCPFCGSESVEICEEQGIYGMEYSIVYCHNCEAIMGNGAVDRIDTQAIIEAWNRRTHGNNTDDIRVFIDGVARSVEFSKMDAMELLDKIRDVQMDISKLRNMITCKGKRVE